MACDEPRTGAIFYGQFWVALHGNFKPDELRWLADRIERGDKKAASDDSDGYKRRLGD